MYKDRLMVRRVPGSDAGLQPLSSRKESKTTVYSEYIRETVAEERKMGGEQSMLEEM